MWNVKTKVIPVIIGATGTISKSFRKYVSNIPGKLIVQILSFLPTPKVQLFTFLTPFNNVISELYSYTNIAKSEPYHHLTVKPLSFVTTSTM